MRTPVRLGSALGAAAFLTLTLGGCSGAPSALSTQPGLQQSMAKTSPDTLSKTSPGVVAKKKRTKPTEIFNQFNSVPQGPQPTNFEVVLQGNQVSELCGATNPPCLNQALYGPYNPFCPPSQGPCYPTVTYNPSTNTTTVTYSGSTLYQNIPGHSNYYHFGLFATPTSNGSDKGLVLSSYWSYPSSPNAAQPIVSINSSGPKTSASWQYAMVYVAVALTKGGQPVYGTWNEVAYVPKGSEQPKLTFKNYGTQTLYVVSSGIIPAQSVPSDPECLSNPSCPENMTILASENFAGSPPPGEDGSQFIPLSYPPEDVLKPSKP